MISFIRHLYLDLKSMPRPVWFLLAGSFINRFGAFVYPFLTLYLSKRGFSAGQIALVLAAMGAGHFLGPIASGYLSDAIGRRKTIVVSLFGAAASMATLYFCHHPALVAAVAFANGFLNFLYGPASSALLTDLVTPEKRVAAFALMRLAVNAGFAAGPTLAGLLFARAPILIFVGDALTTAVFAVIALLKLPTGLRTIAGRATSPRVALQAWVEAITDMRRNAPYLQFLAVTVMIGVAFTQIFNVLVLTATDRGLSPEIYGWVMGLNGILIVVIELPVSRWAERFSPRRVLCVGYVLIGLSCGLFARAQSPRDFFVAMAVFTLGEVLALPIGMAYSSHLAPSAYRGRYFGFRGMAWGSAGLIGSIGVWGYATIGPAWWWIVGLFALGAAGSILPTLRDRRDSTPTAVAIGIKTR